MLRLFVTAVLTLLSFAVPVLAQDAPTSSRLATSLATVTIPQTVLANGMRLAPGRYEIRLTGEALTPLPGQSSDAERRVEFVMNGTVVAHEVATIYLPDADAPVATSGQSGASVQLLKGGDFVRVSMMKGGVRYLIHLPVAP